MFHFPAIKGPDGSASRVKTLNTDYFQRLVVARQLLRWNFLLGREEHIVPEEKIRKFLRTKAVTYARWRYQLQRRKKLKIRTSIGSSAIASRIFRRDQLWKIKCRAVKCSTFEPVSEIVKNAKEWSFATSSNTAATRRLLQVVRKETFEHNWTTVMTTLADLSASLQNTPYSLQKLWIMWNAGSQALMSQRKNDVDTLIEFSRYSKTILKPYAPRLYVELSSWIVNKKSFNDGLQLINDNTPVGTLGTFLRQEFRRSARKIQHDLIMTFFNAVSSYFLWKRGTVTSAISTGSGSVFSTRFIEATAMSQFQEVAELAETTGADVTIIVQPMVELLMKTKTEFDALKFFQNLVQKYDRNFVLEKMYLEFLEKYFPFMKDELRIYREREPIYHWKKSNEKPKICLASWKKSKSMNSSRFVSDI